MWVVERAPDVILSLGGDLVPYLISETSKIPIVAAMASPAFEGMNLARPGGNLTGVSVNVGPSHQPVRTAASVRSRGSRWGLLLEVVELVLETHPRMARLFPG